MFTTKQLALSLTGALLAISTANAQSASNSISKTYGNTNLGGKLYAGVSLYHSGTATRQYNRLYGLSYADAHLLGRTIRAGEATLYARNTKYGNNPATGRAYVRLKVGNRVIFTKDFPSTMTFRYGRTFKAFPNGDPSKTWKLGPANVTVTGNAWISASAAGTYLLPSSSAYLKLNGNARVIASGWARAGVNIVVARFDADLQARLGNQKLTANAELHSRGIRGSVVFSHAPISAVIKLYVKLFGFIKFNKTIVNWRTNAFTKTLVNVTW